MSTINVNNKVSDPFYRYKMPRVLAKVEGRGNGIKTVIVNIGEISKTLRRPPSYPTKFLGIELGAQVICDAKKDRYIVNGAHDGNKIQELIFDFIDNFVLCPGCENPETDLVVNSKKETIKVKCVACGYNSAITHCHRLNTYIVKNPPPPNASGAQYKGKANGVPFENNEGDAGPAGVDDFSKPSLTEDNKEPEFFTDTSSAAVAERMNQLSLNASLLTTNPDLELPVEERLDMFFNFLKANLTESPEKISSALGEAKRLMIEDYCSAVVAEYLFEKGTVLPQICKYKVFMRSLMSNNRVSQMNFLGGIELIISKFPEKIIPLILKIFRALYEFDIIEEEVFLSWDSRKSSRFVSDASLLKKIHSTAAPFITWLKTADVESEDEGSDDDVVFTKEKETTVTVNSSTRTAPPISHADDDINIDDI